MGVNAARVMGVSSYGMVITINIIIIVVRVVAKVVVVVVDRMHMIENTGIANYTLNAVRGHASTLALGVQAHGSIRSKVGPVKVVVNVAVGAPDATRVVHFHAHRRSLLFAGLSRGRL